MKSVKTLGVAVLFSTLSVAAFAGSGNGADGWRKLQIQQQGSQQVVQTSSSDRASADAYAAQVIAANPSNYNIR